MSIGVSFKNCVTSNAKILRRRKPGSRMRTLFAYKGIEKEKSQGLQATIMNWKTPRSKPKEISKQISETESAKSKNPSVKPSKNKENASMKSRNRQRKSSRQA